MRKILLLLLMVIFIGCADNGVSSTNNAEKRCDYTIHYFHPNIDEITEMWNNVPDMFKEIDDVTDGWSFKDLYKRIISNDTVVYKNELWTEEELNEHLGSNLKPSDEDYMHAIAGYDETEEYKNSNGFTTKAQMVKELEKRQGELLNVSCYEANYVIE